MEKQIHEQFFDEVIKRLKERNKEMSEAVSRFVLPESEYAFTVGRVRENIELQEEITTVYNLYFGSSED